VLLRKGTARSRAEGEVSDFIERTQIPFLRSPMGKRVMPDDPSAVGHAAGPRYRWRGPERSAGDLEAKVPDERACHVDTQQRPYLGRRPTRRGARGQPLHMLRRSLAISCLTTSLLVGLNEDFSAGAGSALLSMSRSMSISMLGGPAHQLTLIC
jgi:hypothetical protein